MIPCKQPSQFTEQLPGSTYLPTVLAVVVHQLYVPRGIITGFSFTSK